MNDEQIHDEDPTRCFALSTRAAVAAPGAFDLAGWSRRGFLGVLAGIAGGAAVGGVLAGCTSSGGNDRQGLEAGASRQHKLRSADPGAGYTPKPPFALTAQSVLSEDRFLVANHAIDPEKDKVVAYTRADGRTEAIILQDGFVKQLYRDPSQAGGWGVYPLPGAAGITEMVASVGTPMGSNSPGNPYLQVCYVKSGQLVIAHQPVNSGTNGGGGFTFAYRAWDARATGLTVSMVETDLIASFPTPEPLVAALVPSSQPDASDAKIYYNVGNPTGSGVQPAQTVSGFRFDPTEDYGWAFTRTLSTDLQKYPINPASLLYIATRDLELELWAALPGKSLQRIEDATKIQPPESPYHRGDVSTRPTGVVALVNLRMGTYDGSVPLPTALVWTENIIDEARAGDAQLWTMTYDPGSNAPNGWVWTNLGVSASEAPFEIPVTTAVTPRSSGHGNLLDVFVSWDQTLRVVRQIEQGSDADFRRPTYTPFLPLQPGVRTMTSQAGASSDDNLIVVASDGTLQTLEKDAVSGKWTESAIQMPADDLQEDTAYRVTLALTDVAWNAPVTAHTVAITASTPAIAVVEGEQPRTVALGDSPLTVNTDADGKVTLALLAGGLSAPTLTVSSAGLPDTAVIYPSDPVNTYMQGGGRLNFLDPMSGPTLGRAQTEDGETVAPDAAHDANVASDAADKMKQAADLGALGVTSGALASTIGRIDGGRPARRTPRRHHPKRRPRPATRGGAVSVEALGSSVNNWAHDVFHAIKKGATAVKDVTVDAEKKTVKIFVDVENWVDNAVVFTITGIEDAAHVLHAVFNKIKGDVITAVKWVRALVGSLLKDSALVARQFTGLFGQTLDFVGKDVDNFKAKVDSFLNSERAKIQHIFDDTAAAYPTDATVTTMGDYRPVVVGRTVRMKPDHRVRTNAGADDDLTPQPHGDWFLTKVKHAIGGSLDAPDLSGRSYSDIARDLRNGSATKQSKFESDCTNFAKNFLMDQIRNPRQADKLSVRNLLTEIGKLIDSAFDYLKSVLDALFEMVAELCTRIKDVLATPIGKAGIAGKLLSLAGLGRFEAGSIATMILAFPATLTYKLINGPSTRPFDYLPNGVQAKAGASPEADKALKTTAATVMGVWGVLDVVGNIFNSAGEPIPLLTPAVDTVAPLIVGALAPPFVTDGLPDWRAMDGAQDAASLISWLFALFPAFIDGMGVYAEHGIVRPQTEDDAQHVEDNEVFNLWAKTACGVMSLVMGIVAAADDPDAGGADYALPVLNNLPSVLACCDIKAVEEATDGIVPAIASVLAVAGAEAGAAVYGSS